MTHHDDDRSALAAGETYLIHVLETSEIPETMPDPEDDWEGCLSVPGEAFPTGRASWAKATG